MNHQKSKELYDRSCRVLAGGVSSEFRKFSYPHPLFYAAGKGAYITDVDGNEYLDFTLSQGPLILGHSHPEVLARVNEESSRGQLFAGQHLAELELAEKLQSLIPCAELMRFSLSGSESDHCALRLARAVTGRAKFVRFEGHYHGWFDNVAVGIGAPNLEDLGERENPNPVRWTQGLPPNIEDESIVLPWNDAELLRRIVEARHGEIAAIITEPVMCNSGCIPPRESFLETVRELCDRFGIVFILDEVITGFRLGMGGAQQFYDVTPDLAIFGKAMASGYPISILCGKEKFMRLVSSGEVIHAGTMNSGHPSIAAALATLEVLARDNVHEKLFRLGKQLMDGLRDVARETDQPLLVQGPGPMFHVGFTSQNEVCDFRETFGYDKKKYASFLGQMQDKGIRLIGRGLWYISAAHNEAEIDRAIQTARAVLAGMPR